MLELFIFDKNITKRNKTRITIDKYKIYFKIFSNCNKFSIKKIFNEPTANITKYKFSKLNFTSTFCCKPIVCKRK